MFREPDSRDPDQVAVALVLEDGQSIKKVAKELSMAPIHVRRLVLTAQRERTRNLAMQTLQENKS